MRERERQLELPVRTHGGKRRGAGRKPNGDRAGVPHRVREPVGAGHPMHVTVRMVRGLPSMRTRRVREVLMGAFRSGCARFGFKLVHFSIQSNHLHLIAEASGRVALMRGMKGLLVRIARRLNKFWGRKGRVVQYVPHPERQLWYVNGIKNVCGDGPRMQCHSPRQTALERLDKKDPKDCGLHGFRGAMTLSSIDRSSIADFVKLASCDTNVIET